MTENRKQLLDVFQNKLDEAYLNYCERHQTTPTSKGLITYLIDKDIIPSVIIKRYAISQEFEKLYTQNEKHKTKTVHALADKFNIPERTIWSILKRHTLVK